MVRVVQYDEDGGEVAAVDLDDFTVEIIYSGIAEMLRAAAQDDGDRPKSSCELSREARQRREKILVRVRS